MHHKYWVCALEPGNHDYWAHTPQLLKPVCSKACALQQEKLLQLEAPHWNVRKSSPQLQQLEKACEATKTQHSQRLKNIKKKKIAQKGMHEKVYRVSYNSKDS